MSTPVITTRAYLIWIMLFLLALVIPVGSGLVFLWNGASYEAVQFGSTLAQATLLGMLCIALLIYRYRRR